MTVPAALVVIHPSTTLKQSGDGTLRHARANEDEIDRNLVDSFIYELNNNRLPLTTVMYRKQCDRTVMIDGNAHIGRVQ